MIWSLLNFAPSIVDKLLSARQIDMKYKLKFIYIMNNLRNKVQLIGRLGQAPEIISFENGNKLAKFSLATNESYKNAKGEKVEETQWHALFCWGQKADLVEKYITKGKEIAVEGKLINRSYETKEGEKRYRTEVQVQEILFLGSNGQEVGTTKSAKK